MMIQSDFYILQRGGYTTNQNSIRYTIKPNSDVSYERICTPHEPEGTATAGDMPGDGHIFADAQIARHISCTCQNSQIHVQQIHLRMQVQIQMQIQMCLGIYIYIYIYMYIYIYPYIK